ncbi:MAG: hypothetical protein ABQ298_07650 [Puniceicoccaceae bacterium]
MHHPFTTFCLLTQLLLPVSANILAEKGDPYSSDHVTAFRFRADFDIELDEEQGWAAPANTAPIQVVDSPFRIRFEVESQALGKRRQYSLQYQHNGGPWTYLEAHHFPYPSAASPAMSVVGCEAFFYGEEADDLLSGSTLSSAPGAGITLAPTTPGWTPNSPNGESVEWEWTLVVRHWCDGPIQVLNGDTFALRLVDQLGRPLEGLLPSFKVEVPAFHLGGTFVETPARIGPWEDSSGALYFIMEPTETHNRMMMIKSTDGGRTWLEIDPEHRPSIGDLEGVASILASDGTLHIVHQTSDEVVYHAFGTHDHAAFPNRWIANSQLIDTPEEPYIQVTDVTLRPDGSLVTVYANGDRLSFATRNPDGGWNPAQPIDSTNPFGLTSPSILCRPDGIVEITYKCMDGTAWACELSPDNTLSPAHKFAEHLGTMETESMAILPLIHLNESGKTIVIFRQDDGFLYLSQKAMNSSWSEAVQVSDRTVISGPVDSDQVTADVIAFEGELWIAFIAEHDRDLYLTRVDPEAPAVETSLHLVSDIEGSWVRGNLLLQQDGFPLYGMIYDAGSKGGSGFNRYLAHPIHREP